LRSAALTVSALDIEVLAAGCIVPEVVDALLVGFMNR